MPALLADPAWRRALATLVEEYTADEAVQTAIQQLRDSGQVHSYIDAATQQHVLHSSADASMPGTATVHASVTLLRETIGTIINERISARQTGALPVLPAAHTILPSLLASTDVTTPVSIHALVHYLQTSASS
jgi:hypothetical protein